MRWFVDGLFVWLRLRSRPCTPHRCYRDAPLLRPVITVGCRAAMMRRATDGVFYCILCERLYRRKELEGNR